MSDLTELVDRYIAVWNTADADARRAAIGELWTDNGVYVDPLFEVQGPDAINAGIGAALAQFVGHEIKLLGAVDAHHNTARFRWELVPVGGGESVVEGFDVAVAENGKFSGVYGFLDKAPAA
ncbi:nuclear transport factor 2 family protein [Actinokineospora sp. NBRC 105648]|uniref:nuclear transport factor 2 family protein n=1 Tax=Actinokineospora sp. NBRC 105648 TaxID=3032206 RepID=UPI0024A2FE7F|nr:nuclear transport factor 2 family protein [Actinokineospora sp. NBRC 105648]GLZ37433.1 isomerase [Actinokineospora sp. NBRC 105648]